MWDERLNDYLDGDRDISSAPRELQKLFSNYMKIIEAFNLRLSYRPSLRSKERFLRRVKREKLKKKIFSYALVGAIAAVIFAVIGINLNWAFLPAPTSKHMENIQPISQELNMEKLKIMGEKRVILNPANFERTANNLKILEIAVDGF